MWRCWYVLDWMLSSSIVIGRDILAHSLHKELVDAVVALRWVWILRVDFLKIVLVVISILILNGGRRFTVYVNNLSIPIWLRFTHPPAFTSWLIQKWVKLCILLLHIIWWRRGLRPVAIVVICIVWWHPLKVVAICVPSSHKLDDRWRFAVWRLHPTAEVRIASPVIGPCKWGRSFWDLLLI